MSGSKRFPPPSGRRRSRHASSATLTSRKKQTSPSLPAKGARHRPSHEVVLTAGGWLQDSLAVDRVAVVSFHHQGIERLGEGLEVAATAADGLVEAVGTPDGQVRAVQWHPEMSHRDDRAGLAVFQAFVDSCRR